MKITKKPGKKCDGDMKFYIETDGVELFPLDRIFVLINQLALNEHNIYIQGGWDEKGHRFLFESAILDAIEFGKKGIDLLDEKNEKETTLFCQKHFLNYTKWKQTTIKNYQNGE